MKKLFQSIRVKIRKSCNRAAAVLMDTRGELATNTIGVRPDRAQ